MYKLRSAPNNPLYITKLLEDVIDDCDSAGYVRTLCHTQDVVDPLLFTTSGEEHVIPKEAIKGVVINCKNGPWSRFGRQNSSCHSTRLLSHID